MLEDWEDWDYVKENYDKHITNKKELKQLEERKLMEEADYQLTKQLFEHEENILKEKNIHINLSKINILKDKNNQKKIIEERK